MIVHNKNLLDNLVLLEEANSLQEAGFINKEQFDLIKEKLPVFRSNHNILVRLGFFLLGSILYLSIGMALALYDLDGNSDFWKIISYVLTAIGLIGSEFLARGRYYQHGLDDAFILGTIVSFGVGISITTDEYELMIVIFVAIASFIMYNRYLHPLLIFIFCCSFFAVLFYGIFEFGAIGKMIFPFVVMLVALAFYFSAEKLDPIIRWNYYHKGIIMIKTCCLVMFYLSCNYWVVRELSVLLLDREILPGQDIPFAYFFYAFTVSVPAIYLVWALKTKDRIMLWISFLSIVFSIFTIRFYYAVLPTEIGLILGGLGLFAIAYFSIKKLKNKERGLTFKPDRINYSTASLNAEAVAMAATFALKPEEHDSVGFGKEGFGGGDFGGGGSSSEW